MKLPLKIFLAVGLLMIAGRVRACDLCAVYRAADAKGDSGTGFVFTLAQQYIPYRTVQYNGHEVNPPNPDYVDSSITHFVLGYNGSSRWGVSLNVPFTHLNFRRTDLRYYSGPPFVEVVTEKGSETGLGDVSLIGRFAILERTEMDYGYVINLLAGVKFPTGDDSRLDEEIDQVRIYDNFLPPNTPHDPLGHSISSVHLHDLALGSGSYDGIFGVTASANWQRFFFNAQFQYYLRTEGCSGFKYGDEVMVSGGPGFFVLLNKSYTLTLQLNAVYDWMARDELLGTASDATGYTAWYLGPLVNFTWRSRLSANVGVDVPLSIDNRGYQSVPDYKLFGGITWRF
ncbi:MAG TPA: hypothetical protein PKA41_06400 [Verrucomicrobiota bacterium]|nr:hypothetical protein [Verrucomicrobiota bacterium]